MSNWIYNQTSGGYDLCTDAVRLHVNTRFGCVKVIYSREQDGHSWTYSLNTSGGRRWRPTERSMEFKDVPKDEAQAEMRKHEETFKTEGLPKNGKDLVETVLRAIAEHKREIVS